MPRLFVAIPVPPDVALALAGALPELAALRPVAPELIHVTLAFLGSVPPDRVEVVASTVRDTVRGLGPFRVRVTGIGRFPERGPARIVWAGTSASREIERAGAAVRRGLDAHRIAYDAKPLRAHITLGRVRDGASPDQLVTIDAAVSGARLPEGLAFDATAVHVMESTLSRGGPRYSSLARIALAGAASDDTVAG